MGRKRLAHNLFVFMNGRRVGTLKREFSGMLQFSYHPDWLDWESACSLSLSMPLGEAFYKGAIVANFFDNLLPDNDLIRERIQARFGIQTNTCFDLLSHIGADCVGALQLLTQAEPLEIRRIDATPIQESAIAALLKGYQTAPLGMDRNSDFRISIAGAQEKTALLWYKNKWCQPRGVTPTTHIIKLPIGYIKHVGIDLCESVENEWLCLSILSAYGLPVNQATIRNFEEIKTLVVERFDRRWVSSGDWIVRLPQEDICQALGKPSALKYESDGGPGIVQIMQVLRGSANAMQDRENFMKTVFLFWILAAIDGHAKNFSISLEPAERYRLTPLYDVMSAYPLLDKHQLELKKIKMAMAVKGKNRHYFWHAIQLRHWISMAQYCQFPEASMQAIITEVCDQMEGVITKVAALLPKDFPSGISNSIFAGMRAAKARCK